MQRYQLKRKYKDCKFFHKIEPPTTKTKIIEVGDIQHLYTLSRFAYLISLP